MSKIICFILCIVALTSFNVNAQTLYVIHKKGKLFHEASGKEIMQGDKLNPSDKIRFADNTASAVLINTKTGRYTLKPNASKSSSELAYVVSQVMAPMNQTAGLNTRSLNDEVTNLAGYFGDGSFLFWEIPHTITLNVVKWPLSPTHYFVYSYKHGGKNVNKKIGWDGNKLLLEQKPLYTVQSELVSLDTLPIVQLYYINGGTEHTQHVVSFHPIFKSKEELLVELRLARKMYENDGADTAKTKEQLSHYVGEVYGKCDVGMLEVLLTEAMK